ITYICEKESGTLVKHFSHTSMSALETKLDEALVRIAVLENSKSSVKPVPQVQPAYTHDLTVFDEDLPSLPPPLPPAQTLPPTIPSNTLQSPYRYMPAAQLYPQQQLVSLLSSSFIRGTSLSPITTTSTCTANKFL
uniref:Uncharacterized protein n=1 Tax=Amphimedon queenslandica TaxID=400682 RepID=A0A1X7UE87_AMPQE